MNNRESLTENHSVLKDFSGGLSKVQMQLFGIILDNYDKNSGTSCIDKEECLNHMELKENDYHLKTIIQGLYKNIIKLEDDDKNDVYITVFRKVVWDKKKSIIMFQFDEYLFPYLENLQHLKNGHHLLNVTKLKTKYGLVLYEYFLYRYMSLPDQIDDKFECIISVEELRKITGTTDILSRWSNFENKVLMQAKDDINHASLYYSIDYQKMKKGRNISEIKFTIYVS